VGGIGGGQALTLKRAPGFSADPNELTIMDEPGEPLYQEDRNALPVTREQVLAMALGPPASSIRVRRLEDGRNAIVTGRQRTKSAAVANAIGCGVRYKGTLASVKEAIAEFRKDADFVARVTTLMRGTPRRLKCDPANDSIANVRGMMATENLLAQEENKRAVIRALQEDVTQFEVPIEMAAERRGISVATAKRWLKVDLSAPAGKPKTRGPATRPSARRIKAVSVYFRGAVENDLRLIGEAIAWTSGEIPDDYMLEKFPFLAETLKPKAKGKAVA